MKQKTLSYFYENKEYFMITAHRGASYEYPENTVLAMEKAVEAGADMIEFDLRGTCEHIPVLLHDATLERTGHGTGMPEDYTLAELKKFNFSYYLHGERRSAPVYEEMPIPTFEEILILFRDKVCMNIQIATKTEETLANVCALYRKYEMYDRGYLTVDPKYVDFVRKTDPEIELCVTRGWQDRTDPENIRKCREENQCRFIQPIRQFTDEKAYTLIRKMGMRSNTYFSDDVEETKYLRSIGAAGVLTNKAHLLCAARSSLLLAAH